MTTASNTAPESSAGITSRVLLILLLPNTLQHNWNGNKSTCAVSFLNYLWLLWFIKFHLFCCFQVVAKRLNVKYNHKVWKLVWNWCKFHGAKTRAGRLMVHLPLYFLELNQPSVFLNPPFCPPFPLFPLSTAADPQILYRQSKDWCNTVYEPQFDIFFNRFTTVGANLGYFQTETYSLLFTFNSF